jgi:polysaccharide pyruvyl transferase WcaK-like protein
MNSPVYIFSESLYLRFRITIDGSSDKIWRVFFSRLKYFVSRIATIRSCTHASTSKKIVLFGNFDSSNFGNESTLRAILGNINHLLPNSEVVCVTTGAATVAAAHKVKAIEIERTLLRAWSPRHRVVQMMRRVCNGVLSEPYQWVRAAWTLRHVEMLIIPGTGLLTDVYGLRGWGPYGLLRWILCAKLHGCKLMFVSVGAGPFNSAAGRALTRLNLSLANYRSYRDPTTKKCLQGIGFDAGMDSICPDLAFSLPAAANPQRNGVPGARRVVGLGLMHYMGRYAEPKDAIEPTYLRSLAQFATWLLNRGYDVRLISGDVGDDPTRAKFQEMLRRDHSVEDDRRIINEPIRSAADLLSQIAETDFVVATRFHNAVLSLARGKPTISISFHHKCESLMSAMELSSFCLDIEALTAEALIEAFSGLEANSAALIAVIQGKAQQFREELNVQDKLIFGEAP